MKTYFMVCVGILVLLAQFSVAQVPENITHQGIIKNTDGELLNGEYNITTKLYEQETGGTALWQETHNSVTVTDGVFNIRLGEVNDLSLDFDKPYWLGIVIDSGDELSPRLPLSSVPYSMRAKVADSFEGDLNISQEIIGSDSTVTGQKIDLKVINNVQTAPITGLDVDISAQGGSVVNARVMGITVDVATLQRSISFEDTIVGLEIDLSQVAGSNPTKIAAIMTGGNVGIGTKNPNEELTVDGQLSLKELSSPLDNDGYGKIFVKSSDSRLWYRNDQGTERQIDFEYAVYEEQQPPDVAGGAFTPANTWITRTLNTTVAEEGSSIQRNGNTITLQPGIYRIVASAPAFCVIHHQTRFRNISDGVTALLGTSEYTLTYSHGVTNRSFIDGIITIDSDNTDFELQHRTDSTYGAGNTLGVKTGFDENNVYSRVYIQKIR